MKGTTVPMGTEQGYGNGTFAYKKLEELCCMLGRRNERIANCKGAATAAAAMNACSIPYSVWGTLAKEER